MYPDIFEITSEDGRYSLSKILYALDIFVKRLAENNSDVSIEEVKQLYTIYKSNLPYVTIDYTHLAQKWFIEGFFEGEKNGSMEDRKKETDSAWDKLSSWDNLEPTELSGLIPLEEIALVDTENLIGIDEMHLQSITKDSGYNTLAEKRAKYIREFIKGILFARNGYYSQFKSFLQ